VPLKIDSISPSYKGFGRIEMDMGGELFAGDFAFVGNDNEFSVEVYHLGVIIFKADEKKGKVTYYYMGNQYDEDGVIKTFLPVKFSRLKEVLIDLSLGKDVKIADTFFIAKSQLAEQEKILYIKIPENGEIKITLEKEQ